MPRATPAVLRARERVERVRQVRGLVVLLVLVLVFSILRFGVHRVFTPGWWRLW